MNIVKIIFGTLVLIMLSSLSKGIIFLLLYAGVRGGWAWFVFCFAELILFAAFWLCYAYLSVLGWVGESRFAATFAAVVVVLLNLSNSLALFVNQLEQRPVLTSLQIIVELSQIVFVIWVCKNTFTVAKNIEKY